MVDKWTNPTTANLRGENSMPLQQTFSSLSTYLGKLDDAITAAAASGVSSIAGTTNQISVSASTGAVTLSLPQNIHTGANPTFAGLTSTGNVTVPTTSATYFGSADGNNFWRPVDAYNNSYFRIATGSFYADAANYYFRNASSSNFMTIGGSGTVVVTGTAPSVQIRETTSTANVDLFLGQNGTDGEGLRIRYESSTGISRITNIFAAGLFFGTNNATKWGFDQYNIVYHNNGNNSFTQYGPNDTWGGYLKVGSTTNGIGNAVAQVIATDGNLHLDSGTNQDIYLNYYSGRPIRVHGFMNMNGQSIGNAGYIQAGATGVTDGGSVSVTNWFRAVGNSGIYFQSYGGGFWMTDGTWIRSYGEKNVYFDREFRVNGVISSNPYRARGSYGAISTGSNGITNTWDGIEFASAQTLMIQGEQYSGVYRNNNTWNWLFSYSGLIIGSDERYKREIQPLNLGLNFIELLEPISYLKLTETPDDDPETTEPDYYYGFSAQNVRAALDAVGETRDVKIHNIGGPNMGLVACTEDAVYDRQYIGINEFIAPMVQAIKELSARVAELEKSTV